VRRHRRRVARVEGVETEEHVLPAPRHARQSTHAVSAHLQARSPVSAYQRLLASARTARQPERPLASPCNRSHATPRTRSAPPPGHQATLRHTRFPPPSTRTGCGSIAQCRRSQPGSCRRLTADPHTEQRVPTPRPTPTRPRPPGFLRPADVRAEQDSAAARNRVVATIWLLERAQNRDRHPHATAFHAQYLEPNSPRGGRTGRTGQCRRSQPGSCRRLAAEPHTDRAVPSSRDHPKRLPTPNIRTPAPHSSPPSPSR